ncbi:MAG: GTP 3',8-cyclase MoaA [Lachnospiraceae bacterium]
MIDGCGRVIDYMRISVTDRCNLRCVYCMPEDGVEFLPHDHILTYEQILLICRELTGLGIKKIKLTGGEPLVRKNIAWLVGQLKEIPGIESVTLTTNGILLKEYGKDLAEAGLDGVNVSLDTLDPEKYRQLTRGGDLNRVLEGIETMLSLPVQVKLNCVPMRGTSGEQDVRDLIAMAKDRPIHVRFIELMPIGMGDASKGFGEAELRKVIEGAYGPLTAYTGVLGNGPSTYCTLEGFQGKVGFVSAVTHKFCGHCNRVRLTSDGQLKTCLQYESGVDLRPYLNACENDGAIAARRRLRDALQAGIEKKPAEHHFETDRTELEHGETKKMFRIGG